MQRPRCPHPMLQEGGTRTSRARPAAAPATAWDGDQSGAALSALPQSLQGLASICQAGWLVIEGPSVARGYLDNKERTEKQFGSGPQWKEGVLERFSADRHSSQWVFHNTGDLVRYNLDGSLHLVGRRDNQVKMNGQRL